MYELFTDGACKGNPGPGGWAYLLKSTHLSDPISRSGGESHTTNNRMELLAVICGFEDFNAQSEGAHFKVFSDSKYVVDAFRQNWIAGWLKRGWRTADKKPVKNKDLWERLLKAVEPHKVEWNWVKGHAGHPENEQVDSLAQDEAMRYASGG